MDDPQVSRIYEFEGFILDPAQRLCTTARGEPVAFTGKAFDALVLLVEHAGVVVPRADLARALWPTTVVEDNNLSQTILALRRALGGAAGESRLVVTIPRRGYQFVGVVRRRSAGASPASNADAAVAHPAPAGGRRRLAVLVGAAAAVLIAVLGARYVLDADTPTDKHAILPSSVAVLPFKNLSPSEDDAFFAAGMHEELLGELARIRGVNVIGSTSVQRYAQNAPPLPVIAAELNVGTVLEGSVRYAADRVRISVRLVDGKTGAELWADTYESGLDDAFRVQSEVAQRVSTALEPALGGGTRAASRPTTSAAAYALYLKTLSLYRTHGGIGVSMPVPIRATMKEYLDRALELDPEFAAALGWRAHVNLDALMFGAFDEDEWAVANEAMTRAVETDARRALDLDPAQGAAHATLARLDMYRWRLADARATLDRALDVTPNDPSVLHYSAMLDFLRGDPGQAIAAARRALELDPKNPAPHAPLSMALRASGDLRGAIAAYERMIDAAPTAAIGYIGLARTQTATADGALVMETLRFGEQFLEDLRSFRLDAALSYAHAGARADAERLVAEFERRSAGQHVDSSLQAMAALARGDHAAARAAVERALTTRTVGADPLPLAQIRENTWSDPALELPEWRELRERLAYRR